jgi:hypothetical protein
MSILCCGDNFLPLHSFSIFVAMFCSTPLAFSTLATSLSLATEAGSIVFRNHTTVATSEIAVCGWSRSKSVVLA